MPYRLEGVSWMDPLSVLLIELSQVGGMGSAVSGSGAVRVSAARGAAGGRVPFRCHVVVPVLFMPRGHAHDMARQTVSWVWYPNLEDPYGDAVAQDVSFL
jgi:hypothetical protein